MYLPSRVRMFSFVSFTLFTDQTQSHSFVQLTLKNEFLISFNSFFRCVSSNSFWWENCTKLQNCTMPPPPRHLSFHLNQTLNINVIKKKKNPCPPLPLSCSSGIGWDVADFHLLHDLFPLKGMWLTKLYKQPLYFELPPTLINTFLSTGPTGYVPRQTSTWLGVVTGGDIDLFRHRYIFVS